MMTPPQDGLGAVRRHFAQIAGVYEAVRTTDVEPVLDLVMALPAGALRGLEVGCGTGRYTELLLDHLAGGSSIVGVDACFQMIQVLRRTVRPDAAVLLVCGDAAALPLPDGVLDFVACFNAIHHLDLDAFFQTSTRQVRPGGHVFVYTRTLEQNARSIWGRRFPGFSDKETRLFRRDRLERAVAATAGLELLGVQEYRFPRRAAVDDLKARVRAGAYSTFSLYGPAELDEALECFVASLRPGEVDWTDENTLVIAQRTAA
jgi:SAM-dependent methyltransferase